MGNTHLTKTTTMETFYSILHIAGIVGIVLFCFSVAGSLESIAKDLRRIADDKKSKDEG